VKGVVVCPQPRAAEVGAEILEKGGNAFDAALATAFSQMVNDPFMCGLGGKLPASSKPTGFLSMQTTRDAPMARRVRP